MIYSSIEQIIGNTPLLELKSIKKHFSLKGNIFAKLEYLNPAGSVKDRVAARMISDGEKEGKIKKGTVIIEPTSGNTGIGLAAVGASKGYKVIIVMPDSMSKERIQIMEAYGARVILTHGSLGMKGAIEKANELAKEYENSFIPKQFENPSNPKAHFETTGPELFKDLNGSISCFISAVGTGGTLTGTGKYLKEKINKIKVIAVEPEGSPLLSKGYSGTHKIQGIGANFVPDILDTQIIDKIIAVSDGNAFEAANILAKKEGILAGISSGAALFAAIQTAKAEEGNIAVILPDTGDRYLSSGLFN